MNSQTLRKNQVSFYSEDSLKITADHYLSEKDNPYILLFHTESSSRGEYDSIAVRLTKMNFNCLAVDLRSGDAYGFVKNLTAQRAREKGFSDDLYDAERDIYAAINYVRKLSDKELILFGSSFSATLALKVAKNNPKVKAVMAFSPGEFFQPDFVLKDYLKDYDKPVFISYSKSEAVYIDEIITQLPDAMNVVFKPESNQPFRGAEMLSGNNVGNNEYWFAILIFIKSLNY